jgi:creatinine amidohydrolase
VATVVEWANLTWPEAEQAVARMPACLVPFGAIEAHGPHMTLDMDTLISSEECRRVCERTGVILLPAMPYGQVWSLYSFPGTLSLSVSTLIAFANDLVRSLRDHGFRLVFLHSGHLGNIAALKQSMRDCHDELNEAKVVLLDCLDDAVGQVAGMLTSPRSHPSLIHSCEIETSMALELAPDRVHMDRAVRDYPDYPYDFDLTPTPWRAVTSTGVLGDATAATAAKGEAIVAAEIDRMVHIVELELAALGIGGAARTGVVDR